ncbi:MAG: hypothetical protein ACI8XC_004509 [Gammaproteobacteria bacterium]
MQNGLLVEVKGMLNSAELSPTTLTITDGLTVKVEGSIANGILIAEEIEQSGRKIKTLPEIAAIDPVNHKISIGFNGSSIPLSVNHQTELENDDDGGFTTKPFTAN